MIDRKLRASWLFVALVATVQVGCQAAAQPAAPDQARATLQQALTAWKEGESPEAFRQRSSITAVDRRWQEGYHLLSYDIVGDGQRSGLDWQCRVRLSLRTASGKKLDERGVYTISTSPALVIVRNES